MKKHNVVIIVCLVLLLITTMGCSLNTNNQDNAKKTSSDMVDYKDLSKKITSQNGNIVLLTDNEESDAFLSVKKGLERIENRMPFTAICLSYKTDEEFKEQVDKVIDNGNGLIWVVGKKANDIKDIASDNKKVTFAVIDDNASSKKEENIFSFRFKDEEAGFLAGYLASLDSKKDKVGMLCDNDAKDISGFKAGVLYANYENDKKVDTKIIKVSNDKDKIKKDIEKVFDSEIDILYVNNSKYNEIAMKSAKENKKHVIAFSDKENDLSKKTLLANLKYELDAAVEIASFDILKANQFDGSYEYGFCEGAINIELCSKNVKKSMTLDRLNALKETLLTDSIKIPKNEKELKSFKKELK